MSSPPISFPARAYFTARKVVGALRYASATPARTLGPPFPRVTVITATYNWSSVLRHAIASVVRQSYPNWELLVIGDACTDDSEEVVASFGDERITWLNLEQNFGSQSGPNNRGLALASGEYVAYLGHDDLWLPNHLAMLVERAHRTGADVVSSLSMTVGPPGSDFRILEGYRGDASDVVPPSSLLHRRSVADAIGGWRDHRESVLPVDADLIKRMHSSGARFASVPALTVIKFPSALRRNSYVEKPSHEQAAYSRRIEAERWFVQRELLALAWLRVRRVPLRWPELPEPPDPKPPGWEAAQYRRMRGLE